MSPDPCLRSRAAAEDNPGNGAADLPTEAPHSTFTLRESSSQPWTPAHLQLSASMFPSSEEWGLNPDSHGFVFSVSVCTNLILPFMCITNFFSLKHVLFFSWCVGIHMYVHEHPYDVRVCMCVCRCIDGNLSCHSQEPFTFFQWPRTHQVFYPGWLISTRNLVSTCPVLEGQVHATTSGFAFPDRTSRVLRFAIKHLTD